MTLTPNANNGDNIGRLSAPQAGSGETLQPTLAERQDFLAILQGQPSTADRVLASTNITIDMGQPTATPYTAINRPGTPEGFQPIMPYTTLGQPTVPGQPVVPGQTRTDVPNPNPYQPISPYQVSPPPGFAPPQPGIVPPQQQFFPVGYVPQTPPTDGVFLPQPGNPNQPNPYNQLYRPDPRLLDLNQPNPYQPNPYQPFQPTPFQPNPFQPNPFQPNDRYPNPFDVQPGPGRDNQQWPDNGTYRTDASGRVIRTEHRDEQGNIDKIRQVQYLNPNDPNDTTVRSVRIEDPALDAEGNPANPPRMNVRVYTLAQNEQGESVYRCTLNGRPKPEWDFAGNISMSRNGVYSYTPSQDAPDGEGGFVWRGGQTYACGSGPNGLNDPSDDGGDPFSSGGTRRRSTNGFYDPGINGQRVDSRRRITNDSDPFSDNSDPFSDGRTLTSNSNTGGCTDGTCTINRNFRGCNGGCYSCNCNSGQIRRGVFRGGGLFGLRG
jgi:hypothetical protein